MVGLSCADPLLWSCDCERAFEVGSTATATQPKSMHTNALANRLPPMVENFDPDWQPRLEMSSRQECKMGIFRGVAPRKVEYRVA